MSEEIDLKQIERKAYTSYHQDGLIDIMIGIALVWFIVCMAVELVWLGGIIVAALIPVYIGAKQKLTIPRIGYAKFGTKGRGPVFVLLGIFICFAFLGLVFALMFVDPSTRAWIELILVSYYNLIIAGIAGGLTLMIVVSTGIKRFYFYTLLILSLFIIAQVLNLNLLYTSSAIAISFIALGVITLIQFLRENPLPMDGV